MSKLTNKLMITATAISGLALLPSIAAANYFSGKQITVQVPSGSGGTYHQDSERCFYFASSHDGF